MQYCILAAKKEDYRSYFYRFLIKKVRRSVFLRILVVMERGVFCAVGRETALTTRSLLGFCAFRVILENLL